MYIIRKKIIGTDIGILHEIRHMGEVKGLIKI